MKQRTIFAMCVIKTYTAKIKTSNDRKPTNDKGSNVRKTPTEGAVMKPATPKTELPPSPTSEK
jgi:hypothetical protein